MTRDDKVEKLRDHLNKYGGHKSVFVSVDGLQALFGQHDELKVQVERWETIANKLGEQVKRLLSKEGERITETLIDTGRAYGRVDEDDQKGA